MSRSQIEFCSFCMKTQNEVNLIDTKNSLLIINENEIFEFQVIFNDVFQLTNMEECICENCKDSIVQFYVFKRNIKIPVNLSRRMITNQIDDFLNQKFINTESIKVIRTLNSITLQFDREEEVEIESSFKNQMKKSEIIVEEEDLPPLENDEANNNDDDDDDDDEIEDENNVVGYETLFDYINCAKCDKIESNEDDLEIHEFLKHSSFGCQLDAIEIQKNRITNNDDAEELWMCSICNAQLEFSESLLHLLSQHCPEILFQINEALNLEPHHIELETINLYLSYVKDCIQNKNTSHAIDDEVKRYFYDTYVGDFDNSSIYYSKETAQEEIHENVEMNEENFTEVEMKQSNISSDISVDDKEWIRAEIGRSKCYVMKNDQKKTAYRCSFPLCEHNFISSSASGLRYHLTMKHLKHRKNFHERRKTDQNEIIDSYPFITGKGSSKNCCNECGLKFKDLRAYQLHEKCHNLFSTIAQYSSFPTCNTCNLKFLNDDLLNQHLSKHDLNENLLDPLIVNNGAVQQQGKPIRHAKTLDDDDSNDNEYLWKCGHCKSKTFMKEEFCNFHIMMTHTTHFICPIDKMIFSGFKSVSLFIHHLRNKHPELFPNLSFPCSFCQMNFNTIYDKLNHMKCCNNKQFQCDHCEKRFFKKGDLLAHLKFVTGEVKFECNICYKKCISSSDLKIHHRSHTKIKPYKCSLCNKTFRTLAARSTHVEGHNTSISFECAICNKSFKQRQMYRRHMKTVHENKS